LPSKHHKKENQILDVSLLSSDFKSQKQNQEKKTTTTHKANQKWPRK
jgi:hypothetical protein